MFWAEMGSMHLQDEQVNQVPPQERVAQVKPYWETLSHDDRVDLLTLDIDFLRQRAVEVTAKTQKQIGNSASTLH